MKEVMMLDEQELAEAREAAKETGIYLNRIAKVMLYGHVSAFRAARIIEMADVVDIDEMVLVNTVGFNVKGSQTR